MALSVRIPGRYRQLVREAAAYSGVPVKVIAAQIDDESSWDPGVVSSAGAEGIAQFEPGTWSSYGSGSPFNPADAFPAYAKYMRNLLDSYQGSLRDALAAYNAGPHNIAAGYGYADTILSAAGVGQNARAGSPDPKQAPYANPLRDVQGLTAERIDMGVDYSGTGDVHALGPGVITSIDNAGWPGGHFIAERLSRGPLAGRFVYVAEDIEPQVQVGDHVDSSTVIGQMYDGGSGIETGFASPPGTGDALGASQFSGENSTAYGKAYSDVLAGLGAPPGVVQSGGVTGTLPSWLKSFIETGISLLPGGAVIPPSGSVPGGSLGEIGSNLGRIADGFGQVGEIIDWLVDPNKEIRLLCGGAGAVLVLSGLWMMSHAGGGVSGTIAGQAVSADLPRPMSLPLGIFLTGLGSVLLFVAFHNLPGQVTDFPSLLGYLTSKAHGNAA